MRSSESFRRIVLGDEQRSTAWRWFQGDLNLGRSGRIPRILDQLQHRKGLSPAAKDLGQSFFVDREPISHDLLCNMFGSGPRPKTPPRTPIMERKRED
jgi:hypothetical protein